jgi:hypothetical protein
MKRDRHYRAAGRPVPTTRLSVRVEKVRERAVQARLNGGRDGSLFWLPRSWPAEWDAVPEVGTDVNVTLPRWLAAKHSPIVALRTRGQTSLGPLFNPPPPLGPEAFKEGSFPMTDHPKDAGTGMLDKNRDKQKPSQPDYFGRCEIDGRRYRISAWIKDSSKHPGQKYMSLSFRPDEQQQPEPSPEREWSRESEVPF